MIYHKFTVIIIRELFWKINANDMQITSLNLVEYIDRLNLIINKNKTKNTTR